MDKVSTERIQGAHPAIRLELSLIQQEIDSRLTGRAHLRYTYVLRTFQEQDDLYALGRTKPGNKVTNARGGQSWHNYGLAVDVCLIIDEKEASWDTEKDFDNDGYSDWSEIVYVFKMYGWEWGGDWKSFKDKPHFQKTFGLTIAEAFHRYTEKKLIPEGNYIRLGQ